MNTLIRSQPHDVSIVPRQTAVIMIDMQRDFLEAGGFGESLGNDTRLLQSAVEPCRLLLDTARDLGLLIIHTREGHRPDLSDVSPMKQARCKTGMAIGDQGPMGKILIRGEHGHDIIDELKPLPGEPVIDKPGKGAFFSTDLDLILRQADIRYLIVCGVTTEVCVHTTVREANDRGYLCLVPGDCCASYFEEFHRVGLAMISAQGGIFGFVTDSSRLLDDLAHTHHSRGKT